MFSGAGADPSAGCSLPDLDHPRHLDCFHCLTDVKHWKALGEGKALRLGALRGGSPATLCLPGAASLTKAALRGMQALIPRRTSGG